MSYRPNWGIGGGGPHASTHATGQSDALALMVIGAASQADLDTLADTVTDLIAVAATDAELASGLAGKANTSHLHVLGDLPSALMTDAETAVYVAAEIDAHEVLADPHSVYQLESEKNGNNGYCGLDASGLVPVARIPSTFATDAEVTTAVANRVQLAGQLGGTVASPDVRGIRESGGTLLALGAVADGQYLQRVGSNLNGGAPSGAGGWTPAWVRTGTGVRYLAAEDGNPSRAIDALNMASQVGPTPTAVGTAVVRLIRFRLPKQLTVSALRIYYTAASVNVFSFAVYRVSDRAKIFNTGLLTSPGANAWGNFAVSGSPVLAAETDYWLAMGVSAVGTTACFRSFPQVVNANVFGAGTSPLADQFCIPVFAQAAVTIGATPTWPATLPVPVAPAFVNATTGTLPAVLLEGTAA
jgi:hypothetical protein